MEDEEDLPKSQISPPYQKLGDACADLLESVISLAVYESLDESGKKNYTESKRLCAAWRGKDAMASHADDILELIEGVSRQFIEADEISTLAPHIGSVLKKPETIKTMNLMGMSNLSLLCCRVAYNL